MRGHSGLVFDGGDPHQGRSVGFYTAIKMDEFNDIRELVRFYDIDVSRIVALLSHP